MNILRNHRALMLGLLLTATLPAWALESPAPPPPSPAQEFGALYTQVEEQHLYPDSKSFADAMPRQPPQQIMREYRAHPPRDRAALADFVAGHFAVAEAPSSAAITVAPRLPLLQHIAALWPQLIRDPQTPPAWSSELDFGHRYVVPGGRFREIYYWDSYFTLLGLARDGHADLVQEMVAGFAGLIERYGHIPNGTRSYYLSRSQPPFFYLMVGLLEPKDPPAAYARYLAALRREHVFWMEGEAGLAPGAAAEHVVRLADGAVLNRYWDCLATPRDESYAPDVELAQRSGRAAAGLYADLRAAAESGWDFSSRWMADGHSLASTHTTAIVPADLNALLYGLEQAIAQGCARAADTACAAEYQARAGQRKQAMNQYLWSATEGRYQDYDWREHRGTRQLSAATLYPLFTGQASPEQATSVAGTVRTRLLQPGGLATTDQATGQQWDQPNGWAPLQWIAVQGLRAYGQDDLARDIAGRWLATVERAYAADNKLVEKYDVVSGAKGGGGGEYPLQDGFGWTNGVTRALLEQYSEFAPPQTSSGN
jgi:alpha,alpha-trehalase